MTYIITSINKDAGVMTHVLTSANKDGLLSVTHVITRINKEMYLLLVTHVITSVNEDGACSRTLKYLQAILCGAWIVTFDCK